MLGGQEGEPVAPPPAPGEPGDFDAAGCEIVASCVSAAWCADYTASSLPADFTSECAATGGVARTLACADQAAGDDPYGYCTTTEDPCTRVGLLGELWQLPAEFCAELGLRFEEAD